MRSPAFRDVVVSGLASGVEQTFNVSGIILRVLSASEDFELALGDDDFFHVEAGLGYQPIELPQNDELTFRSIRVRSIGVSPLDARLQVGTGEIIDNRAVFGGAAVPVELAAGAIFWVRQRPASSVPKWSVSVAAGTWPDILPVNLNRRAAVISNRGAETVFVSDNAGPSPSGIPVPPGETIRVETTSLLRAYNPSAVSVLLVGVEEVY